MTAANLMAWGAQSLILASVSVLAPMLLRLRSSRAELLLSQAVLAAMLLLPVLQPRVHPVVPVHLDSPATAAAPAAVERFGPTSNPARTLLPWETILVAGILVRLVWLGSGLLRLSHYRRHGVPTQPHFAAEDLTRTRAEFLISAEVATPVTFGWWRPVIVVPPGWMEMPEDQRLAIACHELLHVRRRDWLACIAEELAFSLMWFHPLVWFLRRRIRSAREQVVDAEAIRLTQNREPYIEALLAAAAAARPMLDVAAAPSFVRKRDLTHRVEILLQERKPMSRTQSVLCSTFLTGVLFVAGVYSTLTFPLLGAPQTQAGTIARTVTRDLPVAVSGTVEAFLSGLRGQPFSTGLMTQANHDLLKIDPSLVASWVEERPGEYSVSVTGKNGKGVELPRVAAIDTSRLPEPWRTQVTARLNSFLNMPYSSSVIDSIQANTDSVDKRIALRWRGDPNGAMVGVLLWDLPAKGYQQVTGVLSKIDTDALPAGMREAVEAKVARFRNAPLTNALIDEIRTELAKDYPGLGFSWQTVGNETSVMIWSAHSATAGVVRLATLQGKRRGGADPQYPPLAQQARVQGVVKLQVNVGPDGNVGPVSAISGHPLLVPAAVAAVTKWQFEPTVVNGVPVAVSGELTIPFTLPPR